LLHRLHSFRYAARSRALHCLVLETHRDHHPIQAPASSRTIGLREPSEARRRTTPPTLL